MIKTKNAEGVFILKLKKMRTKTSSLAPNNKIKNEKSLVFVFKVNLIPKAKNVNRVIMHNIKIIDTNKLKWLKIKRRFESRVIEYESDSDFNELLLLDIGFAAELYN